MARTLKRHGSRSKRHGSRSKTGKRLMKQGFRMVKSASEKGFRTVKSASRKYMPVVKSGLENVGSKVTKTATRSIPVLQKKTRDFFSMIGLKKKR